jgi:hypothetical protein
VLNGDQSLGEPGYISAALPKQVLNGVDNDERVTPGCQGGDERLIGFGLVADAVGRPAVTSDARYVKMSGITFVVYNPPQLGLPYLAVMIAPNGDASSPRIRCGARTASEGNWR